MYIRPNDNLPFPMMDCCFYDSKISKETSTEAAVNWNSKFRKKQECIFVDMFISQDNCVYTVQYDY
jgi:hypothetical protein